MAYKSYSDHTDDIELQRLNSTSDDNAKEGNGKRLDRTVNFSSDIDINGNKMPRPNKNVQFSTHQTSIENDSFEFEIKPNLIPNRKREEETVMENLRKRVGDLQLDKNWKRLPKEEENDDGEEKPLLKVMFE
jgi:hypothetical protein